MKKIIVFVALIATLANATQAQFQITVNPAPTAFELSSDGNAIILSGSEEGVSYQLYTKDEEGKSISVGDPIKGTGSPITFKVAVKSDYSAVGFRDDMLGCKTDMVSKEKFNPGTLSGVERTTKSPQAFNPGRRLHVLDFPSDYESGLDVSGYVTIVFFSLVFLALLFGIWNRRNLVSGSHTEIKPPCTGTVYPPHTHKKK